MSAAPDASLPAFLVASGLAQPEESGRWMPLAGGVSSDLWRVDLADGSLCVKRALPKLRVAADWQAPVSRNASEWAWLRFAAAHRPENVPELLAHDGEAGLFAMAYLPPQLYPVWKAQLLRGRVELTTAARVGQVLGHLHAASARDSGLAQDFATDENFAALRIEPYLLATAQHHPELRDAFEALAERTAGTHRALVHGDVSPKNILVGPRGPVFLDAECAWYGDPAFDLAFCLNHLLLKCLVLPGRRVELLKSAQILTEAYLPWCRWEPAAAVEARTASLLPALLLARVDGKSPVEYLTEEWQKTFVRTVGAVLLRRPVATVGEVLHAWHAALGTSAAGVA